MRLLIFPLISALALFLSSAHAALTTGTSALDTAARVLNKFPTVGEAANALLPTAADVKFFQQTLGKEADQPMPRVKVKGKGLVIGDVTLVPSPDAAHSFLVNGKVWKLDPRQPMAVNWDRLQKVLRPNTSWSDYVLPEAHAVVPLVIGAAYVAGGVVFFSQCYEPGYNPVTLGAFCGGAAVIWPLPTYYILKEKWDIHQLNKKWESRKARAVLEPVSVLCPAENNGGLEVIWNSVGRAARKRVRMEKFDPSRHELQKKWLEAQKNNEVDLDKVRWIVREEEWSPNENTRDIDQRFPGDFSLDEKMEPQYNINDGMPVISPASGYEWSRTNKKNLAAILKNMIATCEGQSEERQRFKEIIAANQKKLGMAKRFKSGQSIADEDLEKKEDSERAD